MGITGHAGTADDAVVEAKVPRGAGPSVLVASSAIGDRSKCGLPEPVVHAGCSHLATIGLRHELRRAAAGHRSHSTAPQPVGEQQHE
jgi:hypothetical protein